jgi:hypothetical protein
MKKLVSMLPIPAKPTAVQPPRVPVTQATENPFGLMSDGTPSSCKVSKDKASESEKSVREIVRQYGKDLLILGD